MKGCYMSKNELGIEQGMNNLFSEDHIGLNMGPKLLK